MKTFIYISLVLFIVLSSCQKVVDADNLLDSEEKVYIVGLLSPSDTVLRVNVSKALPSIGTELPVQDDAFRESFLIKNATVRISDELGNETNLAYSDSLETYLADASTLSIENEQNYFLEVSVNNKTYNASCRIPKKITNVVYEVFPIEYEIGTDYSGGKLSFQDFPENNNFYALGASAILRYTLPNGEPQESELGIFFGIDEFITDNLNNGGILSGIGSNIQFFGDEIEVNSVTVTARVAHLEEIIFQHIQASELNSDAEGNPFAEYSIAPNNILDDGAVGIFAGYQITEKVVDVEY